MLVAQHDRIRKMLAFRKLQLTNPGPLESWWWLFVFNLGHLTPEVVGNDIVQAELCASSPTAVQLLFRRADGSEARLKILESPDGSYKFKLC